MPEEIHQSETQSPKERKTLEFREFLNQSTNLITIFGIFNALFIYSLTIKEKGPAEFLMPSFFILGLLIWLELIIFLLQVGKKGWKYELFYFCSCCIEIGLFYLFVVSFKGMLIALGSLLIFLIAYLGVVFLITRAVFKILRKRIVKMPEKKRDNFYYAITLIGILIVGAGLLYSVINLKEKIDLQPFFQKDEIFEPQKDSLR